MSLRPVVRLAGQLEFILRACMRRLLWDPAALRDGPPCVTEISRGTAMLNRRQAGPGVCCACMLCILSLDLAAIGVIPSWIADLG